MNTCLQFDEEVSRRIEAIYTTPDIVAQRHQVLRTLELRPGERVLDVGSGPGLLAFEMGDAVGPNGHVCGIDISETMIAMSQARSTSQATPKYVEFQMGDATRLPFPDGAFDVAVGTQVYEYVSDVNRALAELHRILRPAGRALILDTDWDSIVWRTTDRARMDRILAAWSEHLIDPHLPQTLSQKLKHAGFLVQLWDVIPLFNPKYDANTYSYGLIELIVAFVSGRRSITNEEAVAWAEDLRKLGEAGSYFFSLNRYLFLAFKPNPSKPLS